MKIKLMEVNKKSVKQQDSVVYDFTVDGEHSYCVGANKMIVHNCLTTKNTSVGYPMASLIKECYEIKRFFDDAPYIVADGGMKDYEDIIKALALGADYVMLGSIFNKCLESAGDNYLYGIKISNKFAGWAFKHNLNVKKYFRGMSTKSAQKAMGKTIFKTSEGVVRYRDVEYTLQGWVENFDHYLRSAMSYCNCRNLSEFVGCQQFIHITDGARNRFNK